MDKFSDSLVPISGLQHFVFCKRQCALIHIERLWTENHYTAEGQVLHQRVHSDQVESRKIKRIENSLEVSSKELGLLGKTDSVEFYHDGSIILVEYKRGRPKKHHADKVQLCAQALCLEEMLDTHIGKGYLFYGQIKRRQEVIFDADIREETKNLAREYSDFIKAGITPEAVYTDKCKHCSLIDLCLPQMFDRGNVRSYMHMFMGEDG